jgi:hypothetical protein
MSGLLESMGHLAAAALAASGGRAGAITLGEVALEPDGFRVVARVSGESAQGELVVLGRIEGEHAGRQRIHLTCERTPEVLPEPLAAFRELIETARVTIELDFRGEPAAV